MDSGKGSTFAPAFGRNEGSEKSGDEGEKFFESLRPAQDRRRGDAPSVEGTFKKKEHKRTSRRNPRFREKFEYNNITTKSLILAQDER